MPFSRPEEDRVSLSSESGWDQVGALFLISEERSGNRLKEFEEGKPRKRTINQSFVRALSRTAMGAADSPAGSPRPFPVGLERSLDFTPITYRPSTTAKRTQVERAPRPPG
jgi:hypothetical protein